MSKERFTLRAAIYLMPIKDNNILLLRRFNTGWMDGMYSFVAGHLDGNESVSSAMIREAEEEAKLKIKIDDLIPATTMHRKGRDSEYVDFFFVVRNWIGEPTIGEPDKCDSLDWFPLNDLPDNTIPYVKEAVQNYLKGVAFSESGWE